MRPGRSCTRHSIEARIRLGQARETQEPVAQFGLRSPITTRPITPSRANATTVALEAPAAPRTAAPATSATQHTTPKNRPASAALRYLLPSSPITVPQFDSGRRESPHTHASQIKTLGPATARSDSRPQNEHITARGEVVRSPSGTMARAKRRQRSQIAGSAPSHATGLPQKEHGRVAALLIPHPLRFAASDAAAARPTRRSAPQGHPSTTADR